MIAVSTKKKPLPFEPIAYTPSGDTAYYVDPETVSGVIDIDDTKREAFSPSGEPWYPNIYSHRFTIFIPGNPGAGKSYLASDLINMFPRDHEIILFTALDEEDGNFDIFKDRMYKIRMEPENLEKINLTTIRKHCKHPILLFDDIDKIRDKRVEKLTYAILEDALANGRGHRKHDGVGDVHTVVTSHALNDYRKTKYTLENSDYIALFPGSTTYRQFETMFKKLGLSDELCKEMFDLGKKGVRSIIIHKVSPMYLIAGPLIKLL